VLFWVVLQRPHYEHTSTKPKAVAKAAYCFLARPARALCR
jgi:hypothetical protein